MSESESATPVHDGKAREARGYSWETAQPGNFLALRHGAYSPRVVTPLAQELIESLLVEAPDLAAPRYRFAVAAWARAETMAAILGFWIEMQHPLDDTGAPRALLLKELRAAESRAEKARNALGLDPASHVRLVRDRAEAASATWSIDAALKVGSRIIEAREGRSQDGEHEPT